MHLTLHEHERLLVSLAAMVARDRKARGVRLNHPESVAILSPSCSKGHARGAPWPTSWRPVAAC